MQEQDFYQADPLACWLVDKCHLTPTSLGLLSIIITSGFYLVVASVSQTLILHGGRHIGLLQDWFAWVWICLLNPVVFGYYLWSVKAIYKLIQYLKQSDIVNVSDIEINSALSPYKKPWRKFLALAAGVAFGIWYFSLQHNVKNWTGSDGGLPALTGAINAVVIFYAATMLVLTLITNVWVMHQLLGNKQLNINPLHPDRCGGLSVLSQYSLNTAYLAAIFGTMITLSNYQFITQGIAQKYWYFNLLILLYIPVSLVCFFGPLLAARKGMKKAKEGLMSEIAKQFQADYVRIHQSLSNDAESLKKQTGKLQELRSLYTLTNEFPVWPFDVTTFRQYLLSVITPLIPILLKLGEYFFKNQFK
ncbi:MAG: hypothetical protein KME40_27695 [Komarekiella atlantica HA4396-MV6]|jgi:hypothetical protein|nr:hypothetical protein [Komarekiella atlantica HA4396-MV6]